MKRGTGAKRLHATEYLRRIIVVLLCLTISLSAFASNTLFTVQALDSSESSSQETRAETKARLLEMIRAGEWDPYSANMSLDEFYALMELFEEGTLPLKSGASPVFRAPGFGAPGFDEPGIDEPSPIADEVYIPRMMFMFSGLSTTSTGSDSPLEYNNITGAADDNENYPAGLDPYSVGYLRPPTSWQGVKVNEESQAVVIVPDINSTNSAIAGDVDQNLFLKYDGRYVRRVTAQNTEATILGAIKLAGQDEYVYYYLTSDMQSNDVSTTTLPKGQKFIVEYLPIEHEITYEVRMGSRNGDLVNNVPAEVNVNGTDIIDTWENIIFGTDHPSKTDAAAYSFTGYAPYGYTVEFYVNEDDGKDPILLLGKDNPGEFTTVNGGWALGTEPDYINGEANDAHIDPSDDGPNTLTISGNIYNDDVRLDRTVIAVVHEKEVPQFLVAPLNKNVANVSGRGTSASTFVTAKNKETEETETIPYDYEDVFLWASGGASKYEYTITGLGTTASQDNMKDGNIATNDGWGWSGTNNPIYKNGAVNMNQEADGTYSYQWTFQTNSGDDFLLDVLEINGVGLNIPYFAKRAITEDNAKFNQEYPGTDGGFKSWHTEADLADGIHIKVEYLMIFHPDGNPQRVYRITATGARSNVVITGMNLMQYGSGADEFATYQLDGVTGATLKGDNIGNGTRTAAIQYYNDGNAWSDNTPQGTVIVKETGKTTGINFDGDENLYGANIRFKLADGYDSPYYLWESTKGGVIRDQASIQRDDVTGEIKLDTMEKVKLLSEVSEGQQLDSRYIYKGDDGWYYIRVTAQIASDGTRHKIALLTIIARPVRYVARYVPSYYSVGKETRAGSLVGIVGDPNNMPKFSHDDEHNSFLWETQNGINAWEYDTADGAYYDTAVDDIIRLPSNVPTDPGGSEGARYRFVDWVLVDDNYNPIWAWTDNRGNTTQVTTDKYGNRILVTPNVDKGVHHPALLVDGKLIVGEDFEIYWTGTEYDLRSLTTGVASIPDTWVTLTRDGKLAYAKDGTAVDTDDMPEETDWMAKWDVRDANGDAVTIDFTSEYHYRSNHITLEDVNQYAIPNENLGGNETDIYVLRFMPVWEPIENPFHYRVALNWVDSLGNVNEVFFDEYWQEVLTDWKLDGGFLTVQVIKNAGPFLDWIAQHPTYTFWDAVNNNNALYQHIVIDKDDEETSRAAMREEMAKAIDEYLPALAAGNREGNLQLMEQYEKVLEALCNRDISGWIYDGNNEKTDKKVEDNSGNDRDDFWRLGNYAYQVHEDEGTIVVWMYEDKGGLAFRKEVKDEPFIYNDEFYFTVNEVLVGENNLPIKGIYKAYPEQCYDANGNPRATLDKDAWLVEFDAGKVKNIVKNDGSPWPNPAVTYFTLKDGDGIMLYTPPGTYSITELGSKSGGAYRVKVQYDGNGTPNLSSSWSLPDGNLWLKGRDTVYYDPGDPSDSDYPKFPDGVSQVSATVYFEVGEKNTIHTLQFENMTASLSIEKALAATEENQKEFAAWLAEDGNSNRKYHFAVWLELPDGCTPLIGQDTDDEGKPIGDQYYYFSMNVYLKNGSFVEKRVLKLSNDGENTWTGEIDLMGGQRAALVMTAPDDEQPLYYEYTDGSGVNYIDVITDQKDIVDVSGAPYYRNANINCRIFYYSGNQQKVYVSSWDQIQYVTRTKGAPYLIHKNGDSLYYLVGRKANDQLDYRELPASPSDVNLHLATVDGSYQVCEEKEVPLYSLNGNTYQLIKSMKDLKELPDANNVYYRYEDEYYHVELKSIPDSGYEDGLSFEGVATGLYGGEIAMTLKKEFGVYSSRNGSYFSGVISLDDIRVQVDTEELPVSKAIFNYRFEEVWREAEWKTYEWDDENEKTTLFVEEWINQSGVAEIGKQANAKVTNWYIEPDCYLAITETGGKKGETFLYKITDENGNELIVTVTIGEDGKGETIVQCPAGNYTVEEITDWAWRYEDGKCKQNMPINVNRSHALTSPAHADFTNERNNKAWLGGENRKNNRFEAISELR